MTDDQYDDFKQLLTQTIDAAETRIKTEITAEITGTIRADIQELRQEMRDGFTAIGAPIDHLNDSVDDHEIRLAKLEQKAA